MKTQLKDVSATRKELAIEVPSGIVDDAVTRVTRSYGKRARVPGFRPGKVPAGVIRKRFRDQILEDVVHDLVPRSIAEALLEHGQRPLDTPAIRDVSIKEGEPLSFTASFETLPPIDPGDVTSLTLRRPTADVAPDALDQTLEQLRSRAARFEPVEGRPAATGDTLTVDVARRSVSDPSAAPDSHEDALIEIGSASNPPGLDEALMGLASGAQTRFTLTYPDDHADADLAGSTVEFDVTVKAIRHRVLPDLDDEFAKDVGEFESLQALKDRIAEDLQRRAEHDRDQAVRADLLGQLARRITVDLPEVLVERELDRRVEELARRLVDQRIDPTRAAIDWEQFRGSQRDAAADTVRSTLALDEIARREGVEVSDADFEAELGRYAERVGRTPAAIRAQLEKEDGVARVREGMLREKTVDLLLSRATLVDA